MECIRFFEKISSKNTNIAGGKGASLGEMTQAGIPVPLGFVILADVFDKFIEQEKLVGTINSILNTINPKEFHAVETASKKIQSIIKDTKIPLHFVNKIMDAFKKLDAKFVAVRSSATAEDSASAAWAGQLDTYLNIPENKIIEKVQSCWASLFTPRAIFYRFEKKLNKDKISVAVVVQKMINSEESGIAFSVHPVIQDKNQIIIEAGFGLGEAIVSGTITPDSYIIDKQKFKILNININEQKKALYRKTNGGNKWKELKEKGKKQALTKKEIIELSKLIVKIENHYGFPCDIEWAKEKEKFYITQSRPITTLLEFKKYLKIKNIASRFIYPITWHAIFKGSSEGLKKVIDKGFKYCIVLFNGKTTDLYRELDDMATIKKYVLKYIKTKKFLDTKMIKQIRNKYDSIIKKINLKNLDEIIGLFTILYPYLIISYYVTNLWRKEIQQNKKDILKACNEYRIITEGIQNHLDNFLEKLAKKEGFSLNLTYEELKNNLKKGKYKKHYIFYNGEFLNVSWKKFLHDYAFQIVADIPTNISNNKLSGQTAYPGKVKGKVILIFGRNEFNKIKTGDILVTPMTQVDFLPIINKASAIVTNEGGITCHAAIVSRELKKPCIVGTKIATKVLKDGDLVEVDANKGILRILKNQV